jgi:hypothetical protein
MTKKATTTKRGKGLDVANYWVSLFYYMTGKPVPFYFREHKSAQTKIMLNTHLHRIRAQFKLPPYEMKPLIYFRYVHNPLGYNDIAKYGNLYNLPKTIHAFRTWKASNKELIDEVGIFPAINATAPELCQVDSYLMEQALSAKELEESWI